MARGNKDVGRYPFPARGLGQSVFLDPPISSHLTNFDFYVTVDQLNWTRHIDITLLYRITINIINLTIFILLSSITLINNLTINKTN